MENRKVAPIPEKLEKLATEVIDAAFSVHYALGPGLLESVYQSCLCYELSLRKIKFRQEVVMPITYKNLPIESGLRIDLFVEETLVLELKAVEKVLPIHEAQLMTYLKLTKCRLGFLFNFNVTRIKNGIHRIAL